MSSMVDTALDHWVTVLLAATVFLMLYVYKHWMHMPNGPWGLPYIGYYPFLSEEYHLDLGKMSKKYGEVFCFNVTGQTYAHLGSVKAMKETHVAKSHCFAARPKNFSIFSDSFRNGVAFSNGEQWKVLRKFFVQQLKDYGMGKKTQESLLSDCLHKTVDTLKDTQGTNFDGLPFFKDACSEISHCLLFSGIPVEANEINELNDAYDVILQTIGGKVQLLSGPFVKYFWLFVRPELRNYTRSKIKMESILKKIIREHENTFDKDNLRDLVDCYICEREVLRKMDDPKADMFSEEMLVSTLVQFFGDGGLSVGYLISIVLSQLSEHPDVQKEIQRELDEVVGCNRFPLWDDRNRMSYTNSAILEIIRVAPFLPAFPSLECTKETTVCGCVIPKGAITLMNFWAALHDPAAFKEPEKFDPSRFLSNEVNKTKTEAPIIFGVGKRACIGEALVNMETFLFVTTILQNFNLSPAKEDAVKFTEAVKSAAEHKIYFRATPREI